MNVAPIQKPGRSIQNYASPANFIEAVKVRFGPLAWDLAASTQSAQSLGFYDEHADALTQPWAEAHPAGNLWLNPPYGDISPWAEKCRLESKKRHGSILMLVPASIGARWFANDVKKHAMVLALTPRLTFGGCSTPYPKDCILAVYGYGFRGFDMWDWRRMHVPAELNGGVAQCGTTAA